jgi:hypothetical protein
MTNQHPGLNQTLAAQHTTELQEQGSHQRLLQALGRPHRRTWSIRRRWQLLDRQVSPRPS